MGEAHNVRVIGLGKQKIVLGHGFGTDQSVWNWSTLCLISLMNTVSSSMIIWGRVLQTLIFFYFERYSTLEGFAYACNFRRATSWFLHLCWPFSLRHDRSHRLCCHATWSILQDCHTLPHSMVRTYIVVIYKLWVLILFLLNKRSMVH